ncbi:MAG TPA: TIGR03617 family F420-dependent LLM class oxidoreductase [Acidimicrobiales bacterium]|nr:TIGR03617 family F420-dependent LLM class oxidoreductase [Acidimicrobiales bacterium]
MLVDGPLITQTLPDVAAAAEQLEDEGYDGTYTFEGPHDPFLPLVLAAEATDELELMTAVAIAFSRNPMTLASQAWDLQALSEGRFHLGLGSQVKAHIERRFSMPWVAPAARMRELVLAIRAIWTSWQDRVPLRFEGEHYTHTLMTPFFDPGPIPHDPPAIWLGGVGPRMTEVAGEVADGFFLHPFCTQRSLIEVTLPALERGRTKRLASLDKVQTSLPVMIVTGATTKSFDAALESVRAQVGFYASTPAYKVVLDVHGLGDLQPKLQDLTRTGDWGGMAALVPDDLLDAVAIVAPPDEVAGAIEERYGTLLDRVALNAPYVVDKDMWGEIVADLQWSGDA